MTRKKAVRPAGPAAPAPSIVPPTRVDFPDVRNAAVVLPISGVDVLSRPIPIETERQRRSVSARAMVRDRRFS